MTSIGQSAVDVGGSSGGGSGTVTDVTSPDGSLTVATGTTTPKVEVAAVKAAALVAGTRLTITTTAGKAKLTAAAQTATGAAGGDLAGTYPDPTVAAVPAAALVAGTHITITTTAGKAKLVAAAGSGTVTKVESTVGDLTVTTTTTTPNLSVAKVPSGALVAGTRVTITTTLGKAKVAASPKLLTTTITGNPAAAGELLVSTAADAAAWTATPPGAKKINATVVTGNSTAATQVLIATAADAAHWAAIPASGPITAETPAAGVAMTAAAQTILSLTVPTDGKVHIILSAALIKDVTTALTGGTVFISWTDPTGVTEEVGPVGGTAGLHYRSVVVASTVILLKPGTTVTLQQTAMTAGAGTVYGKIVIL